MPGFPFSSGKKGHPFGSRGASKKPPMAGAKSLGTKPAGGIAPLAAPGGGSGLPNPVGSLPVAMPTSNVNFSHGGHVGHAHMNHHHDDHRHGRNHSEHGFKHMRRYHP